MSKGTRIVLAFSVLFVGVLVAYYGFILKDDRSLNVDNRRLVDPTLEPAGASNSPGEEETGRDSADEGIAAAVVEWGDGDPSRAAAAGDGLVEERHLGEFESRPSAAAAVTGGAPQEALTDGSEPNGEEERTGLDPLPPAVTALEMGASPQPGTTAHDLLAAVGAVTSSPEDQPLLDERATPTSVGTSGQGAQAPDAAPRETPSAPEPVRSEEPSSDETLRPGAPVGGGAARVGESGAVESAPGLSGPGADGWGTYRIEEGDTLVSIAERWFGDGTRWPVIAQANPALKPSRLRIGTVLRLPPRTTDTARIIPSGTSTASPASAAASEAGVHIVRAGETLSSIARKAYGNVRYWKEIFEANRKILSAPDKLKLGMRLVLPKIKSAK